MANASTAVFGALGRQGVETERAHALGGQQQPGRHAAELGQLGDQLVGGALGGLNQDTARFSGPISTTGSPRLRSAAARSTALSTILSSRPLAAGT